MENLTIQATAISPMINFVAGKGLFEIKGRSVPENAMKFYDPLLEWTKAYVKNPLSETLLELHIEYFNTSSSKCLLQIFKQLEAIHGKSTQVRMIWFYSEDDMLEVGEDYQMLLKIPIELREIEY